MKKQIKQKVNDALNTEVPELLSRIKNECETIVQVEPPLLETNGTIKGIFSNLFFRRFAFGLAACALFFSGILIGNIEPSPQIVIKETSIYLDVNPSIEIQVDENNYVIECIPGNLDGMKILENISLNGVEVDTALYAIVGAMYTNGYLNNETNSILVSVDSINETDSNFLNEISEQIANVFKDNEEMKCSIIAQKVNPDSELKGMAERHSVSIGKMHLIEKIIEKSELYTNDNIVELVEMSIHELDLIYQTINGETREDEIISGKPGGFIMHNEALNYVLEYLKISSEDVKWHDVVVLYHHDESNERKMVYLVTVILVGKEERCRYIVDCSNGKILSEETVDEWEDIIPNDGPFGGPKGEPGPNEPMK